MRLLTSFPLMYSVYLRSHKKASRKGTHEFAWQTQSEHQQDINSTLCKGIPLHCYSYYFEGMSLLRQQVKKGR